MSESEKESTLDESRVEQEEVETVGKEEREFFFGSWKKSRKNIWCVYNCFCVAYILGITLTKDKPNITWPNPEDNEENDPDYIDHTLFFRQVTFKPSTFVL